MSLQGNLLQCGFVPFCEERWGRAFQGRLGHVSPSFHIRVRVLCLPTPAELHPSLQRIRATVNSQEQKRLLMDLDVNMRTVDCFYTVTFYGALFREV